MEQQLMIVYRGNDKDQFLYTAYFDGNNWLGNERIKDQGNPEVDPQSDQSPSIVTRNNWQYVIYKGHDSDGLRMSWNNGDTWVADEAIKKIYGGIMPRTQDGVSSIRFDNQLVTIYKLPNDDSMCFARSNGTMWDGNRQISGVPDYILPNSSGNPVLVEFNKCLYAIYKGANDSYLYYIYFQDGCWRAPTLIEVTDNPKYPYPESNHRPGAVAYKGKLYIIYKGKDSTPLYSASFDGKNWKGNTKLSKQVGNIDPKSDNGANAIVYQEKLYIVYKSADNNNFLYYAWFDGNKWEGDKKITIADKSNPRSECTPGITVRNGNILPILGENLQRFNWMSSLKGDLSIGEINIPGSHDSASINGNGNFITNKIPNPYACQNASITRQLMLGIRFLDVRLKVMFKDGTISFNTCHGNFNFSAWNEFQTFATLITECKTFLETYPSETIIMYIRIDDWNNYNSDPNEVYNALWELLQVDFKELFYCNSELPTLGQIRSKILLLSDIPNEFRLNYGYGCTLGAQLRIPINTIGQRCVNSAYRKYNVFAQDKFEALSFLHPTLEKTGLVKTAFTYKPGNDVVLNFASATWLKFNGVYIMRNLLNYFGSLAYEDKPKHFGWTLFDYPFEQYPILKDKMTSGTEPTYLSIIDLLILSNYNYTGYMDKFHVYEHTHTEL